MGANKSLISLSPVKKRFRNKKEREEEKKPEKSLNTLTKFGREKTITFFPILIC